MNIYSNLDKSKKIKYLHIMTMGSVIYDGSIIKMINENPEDFNQNEHLFILTCKSIYDVYQHYSNVIFEQDLIKKSFRTFLNFASYADYIFMHSLPLPYLQMIKLRRDVANKIVWCVWGHDLYNKSPVLKGNATLFCKIKRFLSRLRFDLIYARKVKQFHAIGIGFKYDALEIRKLFDETRIVFTPYGFGYPKSDVDEAILDFKNRKENNDNIKIMIGHCSYSFLKHEEILNKLLKFKEQNITIAIPLSYGNKEYGEHIEKIARELFGEKVQILKEYISPTDYIKFLISVDLAIFDYEHQAGLANILLLLYLSKKVYLSNTGVIHWAMRAEGIKTYEANDIGAVTFDELSKKHALDEKAVMYSGCYIDETNINRIWKTTLKEL